MSYPYSERLKSYRQEVDFALEQGEGPCLRTMRDHIASFVLTAAEQAELDGIDSGVIEFVITLPYVAPYLLDDDKAQLLTRWWWHLGAIRRREFPANILPPFLRSCYGQ